MFNKLHKNVKIRSTNRYFCIISLNQDFGELLHWELFIHDLMRLESSCWLRFWSSPRFNWSWRTCFQLTYMTVGSVQLLADCWLQSLNSFCAVGLRTWVPHHTMWFYPEGSSQCDCFPPLVPDPTEREKEPRMGSGIICNQVWTSKSSPHVGKALCKYMKAKRQRYSKPLGRGKHKSDSHLIPRQFSDEWKWTSIKYPS